MNKDLRDKWVKALRSGRYKQGNGQLRIKSNDGFEYCCLGVLCNLVNGRKWVENRRSLNTFTCNLSNVDGTLLRSIVAHELGINDQLLLARLNDAGRSFDEIASYIEQKVSVG